ncbi:hypothetical protein [Flagellimonas aurea]|uniref:hypothetical protein n=1 Tax=Flagellimonas aurea TaxID=2915619 RepID=UPI0035CF1D3B
MKCIGRTKEKNRCKRECSFLFCHQHKFQFFVWTISFLSFIALIGGLYQDIIKPFFVTEEISISDVTYPVLESRAKKYVLEYHPYNDNNLIVYDCEYLDFDKDGEYDEILVRYKAGEDSFKSLEILGIKQSPPDLKISHEDWGNASYSVGLHPILLNNEPFLAYWNFAGSMKTGSVIIYKRNSDGLFFKYWEEEIFMNGFGEVVDGKLYIGIGMENYSLEIKEDKPFLRKIGLRIEEDPLIGNNESEKIINLSLRNISEVGLWYEFKIGDRELEVVETSGQQDEYFVPWSHYTLKMDVKKGSIIRFISEMAKRQLFLQKRRAITICYSLIDMFQLIG